jgi:N-hydroxyarylamine O-acetyltransferase
MDFKAYLERINYQGALLPTVETLRDLQIAHLLSVPFENLSIHSNEPIILEDAALFEKIVLRLRGGFCYELNGLFAALLRQIGFQVTMLSAGVANAEGDFGPEFDHMTLMVSLQERWLVDVGFGDSFQQPLLVDSREVQSQGERAYQIDAAGESLILKERIAGGDWKPQYRFTLQAHQYADYLQMCHFHQTSPESHFTRQRICSVARPDGRTSLSDMRLIETKNGERTQRMLKDEKEYACVLQSHFGISLRS